MVRTSSRCLLENVTHFGNSSLHANSEDMVKQNTMLSCAKPQGKNSKQEMGAPFFSPLFGGITNTPPTMEYPQLYNSWSRCKDGSVVPSLHDCASRRAQVKLSYSASDPDMFGLVTSILQEPSEQEPVTDWNSLSRLFPPLWTLDSENNGRCSRLFPTKVLDSEKLANLVDARSPYGEYLGKAFSVELLPGKLRDLRVTGSWPAPSHPGPPSSDEVLKTSDPEGKGFTCDGFRQQPSFAPECSYEKETVGIGKGNLSSSQPKIINSANFYGGCQETNATGGVLGAGVAEEAPSCFIQLPDSAVDRIWGPAVQENRECAKRCAYESPQSPCFLSPTFEQDNSLPEGVNAKLHKNYQQSCPNNMGIVFDNVESKTPAYPPQDPSKNLSLNPGQLHKNSSYGVERCLESEMLNPAAASHVTYRKQKRRNTLPRVSSTHHALGRPFCSQVAARKNGMLLVGPNVASCLGFSSCKENLKPHNSAGCSRDNLRAPTQEYLGETSVNISPRGSSWHPSANKSAKCYRFDNLPNRGRAGERTGQKQTWHKTNGIPCAASVGPAWAQLDASRRKQNEANLSDSINPPFLPLFPLAPGYTKIPNFPAFHLPPFSPSANVSFPPLPLSELVGLHYDDFPHLSPSNNDLFCGDVAVPDLAFSPRLNHYRCARNRGGPARELYIHLEECYEQWRALERERKKIEADLARTFPGKPLSSSNNIPFSRLPAKPSRVDRLILDQFREQARVRTLLGKMERLCGIPIHSNISATLGCHLEAIYTTQTRRKDEIVNAGNPQRPGTSGATNEKDVLALAAAVKELASVTRKTRTALWCVFQTALPKMPASPPVQKQGVQRAPGELGPAKVPLQRKTLPVEGEDQGNERRGSELGRIAAGCEGACPSGLF